MAMIVGGDAGVEAVVRGAMAPAANRPQPGEQSPEDGVRVVCLPSWDETFARIAEQHVAAGARTGMELERLLRLLYPFATVQPRRLSGERQSTWYVYRDREAMRRDPSDWWASDDTPRLEAAWPDGEITQANAAAEALFGAADDGLVGRALTDLLEAGAVPSANLILELLRVRGRLETVMALRRQDGTRVLCEALAIAEAERIECWCRIIRSIDEPATATASAD